MFGSDRKVEVELLLKNKSFNSGLQQSESKLNMFSGGAVKAGGLIGGAFKVVAVAAAAVTTAVTVMTVKGVQAASALQESTSKFKTVFSEVEEAAFSMAQNLQDNYGVAKRASYDLLSSTGDLLSGFGFAQDQALSLSNEIAMLGADMASFQNIQGGAEEAASRITAALLGETEGMKALGVKISQTTSDFKDHVKQVQASTGATEAQAKALVIMEEIAKQSGNSIGDLARTQDSFANVQRRVSARMEDMFSNFGEQQLAPLSELGATFLAVSKDGTAFAEVMGWIAERTASAIRFINELLKTVSGISEELKMQGYKKSLEETESRQDMILDKEARIGALQRQIAQEAGQGRKNTLYKELQKEQDELDKLRSAHTDSAKHAYDVRKKYYSQIPEQLKIVNERIEKQEKKIQADKAKGWVAYLNPGSAVHDTAAMQLENLKKYKATLEKDMKYADQVVQDSAANQAETGTRSKEEVLANIREIQRNFKSSEESKTKTAEKESKKRVATEDQALQEIESDTTSWQSQYRDAWIMMSDQIEDANKAMAENVAKQYPPMLKELDDFIDISTAKWGEYWSGIESAAGKLTSAISNYYQLMTENRLALLDKQYEEEQARYDSRQEEIDTARKEELERLEEQLESELERKGLADQTELERAEGKVSELERLLEEETDANKRADLEEQLSDAKKEAEKYRVLEDYAKREERLNQEQDEKEKQLEEERAAREKEYQKERQKIEKENFGRQKAIQIMEATIAGATGAVQAYKALAGIPIIGPGLGAAAAATLLRYTAGQVAEIKKQQYVAEHGLIVPGTSYSGDNVNVGVNSGEMILTRDQQRELFNIAKGSSQQGAVAASPGANTFNLYIDLGYETITRQVQTGINSRDIYITADDIAKG